MNEELKKYEALTYFLGSTIPKTFEVILFDAAQSDYPVVAHVNKASGTLRETRRNLALATSNAEVRRQGRLVNRVLQSDSSKMFKSSLYLIKEDDEVVGALCLNMQCDIYMKAQDIITSVLAFNLDDLNDLQNDVQEDAGDISVSHAEPTLDTIAEIVHGNVDEPKRATVDERIEIIIDLYDLGIFEIKGAVARTAEELCISEQSVYRYISKIKKARG